MPLSKKTLLKTEKVTTSEEVEKGTKILYDKKEAVVATPLSKEKYGQLRKLQQVRRFTKVLKLWMI